jgi:hypothetical protein
MNMDQEKWGGSEAYSPGLSLTQARYCHIGWHHQSGADHKQAISKGYPSQLGGAASAVSLLKSLLIGIKFPVIFSINAQNPNGTSGFIKPVI